MAFKNLKKKINIPVYNNELFERNSIHLMRLSNQNKPFTLKR